MEFIAISATAYLIMLGEHFIPFQDLVNKSKLPRLAAYVIGSGTVAAMQITALAVWPGLHAITVIIDVLVFAGFGVFTGYWIDTRRHADQGDQLIDKMLDNRHEPHQRA